jgi:2-polyprenyl-3-methyl-5-hydroxy-6-metoxy-1,4-benzoquinol methylase
MSAEDRERWEVRYRAGDHSPREPSRLLTDLDLLLPRQGRALDVAGGAGRHAVWLAQRGLSVTLCDISPTALALAHSAATAAGVSIDTIELDLEHDPLPRGPWDLILSFHYLDRRLFDEAAERLTAAGVLVFVQPTTRNLERHARPGARFLLDEGELLTLAGNLNVVRYREGWLDEGRHEALLVARGPGSVPD